MPLVLDIFRLNLMGKYLTYAFVAVGLVLCWGYSGILSLGQGVFFGLGGYCMAMFLKLEASTPADTRMQTTPGIPDFMDWNQLTALPSFWYPFHSFGLTLLAILIVPTFFAWILGSAMFRRRVGGVYFAIITQAISAILTILIIGQQGYTGGINGITDLRTLLGWDIRTDSARYLLYFVNAGLLMLVLMAGYFIVNSKFGRLMVAIRDKEDRVRFSGYDVASIKTVVFCISALFSALGGAMFTLQVGFMSPGFIGTVASIEMVIFCAVGGRGSLLGAVFGALIVNAAKSRISESFPELWTIAMGMLFIGVVLVFPKGLAGIYQQHVQRRLAKYIRGKTARKSWNKSKANSGAAK
ncbi:MULTISPECIES: urea ABC transporter permease subunit UrtC [Klebsiella pneumoniae complex]|nr:urea ABC transporter permease subunit UrtC [Klebsiella quasipneumoniae]